MKQILIIICLVACCVITRGQSLSPQVLASTGGFFSNAANSFSYTVGEMTMVQTFSNGNIILTQGFQQSDETPTGIPAVTNNDFGTFTLYPVPTVDKLSFNFQFSENGSISISVFNDLGQKTADVYNATYSGGKTAENLNVSVYPAGIYFLTLSFTSAVDGQTHFIFKKFQIIN